ncbi:MAG: four helix bundle protein [Sphingobacteriales bacterium]|nr:MAG: four helix bundle protein [Sphingobacteriales bacterium]
MSDVEKHQSFTELKVWQKARALKNDIFQLVKSFPTEEKYRLVDQIVRSSRSVGANIAEGHGRFTFKEQVRYCIQGRGSLSETLNHLVDSLDCNYINEETFFEYKNKVEEVERLLNGYITYLRNKDK